MKRTKIIDALQSTDYGKEISVCGWVRTHRSSKSVDFIQLNDGSTIKNVQIVVDTTLTSYLLPLTSYISLILHIIAKGCRKGRTAAGDLS